MEKKKLQKIKPIAIAIAIILIIIALTFGESKYLVRLTSQASITFSKTNYQNVEKNQGYKTLQEAVSDANDGNTIKVLKNVPAEGNATVDKSIILDLNGKTVALNNSSITNNGTLTVTDATETHTRTTDGGYELNVAGRLTSNVNAIINNGTLNVAGNGEINGTGSVGTIANLGILSVTSGTISSTNYRAIVNGYGGVAAKTTISGGTVIASRQHTIHNYGVLSEEITENIVINGTAKIITEASKNGRAIANANSGKVIIEGGELEQTGTVTVSGTGTYNPDAVVNDSTGTIEITGGKITAKTASGIAFSKGEIIITGGEITGSTNGIWIGSSDTPILTIGDNSNAVSTTTPRIIATGTNGTGINVGTGTFNFYDGIIKGSTGKSIDGTVSDTPTDYVVIKGTEVIDGTTYETATLHPETEEVIINTESMYTTDGLVVRLDGVHNHDDGKKYSTTTWKKIGGTSTETNTITDGTWGENYLEFNGTSTWVNLGAAENATQTIQATFAVDALEHRTCIIGNQESAGGGIFVDTDRTIKGEFHINNEWVTCTAKTLLELGKVYDVVINCDGNTINLYVNGILEVSKSVTTTITTTNMPIALGTNPDSPASAPTPASNRMLKGKIYTAAVYKRALTDAEIVQNANASLALAGGPTSADTITYTMRFKEPVNGFDADDITITNGTKENFTSAGDNQTYTIDSKLSPATSTTASASQTITIRDNCATTVANGAQVNGTSRTVYRNYNYKNLSTNTYYRTLAEAFAAVEANTETAVTIQTLNSTVETSAATLAENKNATLDLNGKTIATTGTITNNGILTVTDTTSTQSETAGSLIGAENIIIINNNTLTIDGKAKIKATTTGTTNTKTIDNNGLVTVKGGLITSETGVASPIHNTNGTVEISGGILETKGDGKSAIVHDGGTVNLRSGIIRSVASSDGVKYGHAMWINAGDVNVYDGMTIDVGQVGLWNNGTGTINVYGGSITSVSRAIYNSKAAAVNISGGTITSLNSDTVVNQSTGTITITDGTINATGQGNRKNGIYNSSTGSVIMNGGTINVTSTNQSGISNTGTGPITVNGGTINAASAIWNNTTGSVTVTGGTLNGTTNGIHNASSGTVTIGTKDTNIPLTTPTIIGGTYGVDIASGTFKFYDGVIKGPTGNSINGTVSETPTGYGVLKTQKTNTEEATLSPRAVFDFNEANNVNMWTFKKEDRFTALNYDSSTGMNTITVNGNSGWEQIYIPIKTVANQKYTFSLDYNIPSAYTTHSTTYEGLGIQAIASIPPGNDNLTTAITTTYLPKTAGSGTHQMEFTATGTTTYLLLNFGMLTDGVSTTINLGNFRIAKPLAANTALGDLPDLSLASGYKFAGWNGKNLFNKNAIQIAGKTYIKGDGTTVEGNEYSLYQTNIEPSTTYTITNSGGSTAPGYAIYDASGSYLRGENYANRSTVTFTTPANAAYIKFSVVTLSTSNRYDKDTFQLEEGSAATSYENYFISATTTTSTDVRIYKGIVGPGAPTISAKLNNASGASYTGENYTNQNVYVIISPTTVGEAGIREYQWYENGAWTTRAINIIDGTGRLTYTANRNENIRYRVVDNNGLISDESTFNVKIDKTAPTIKVTTYKYDSSKTNNAGDVVVAEKTFTADGTVTVSNDWVNYGGTFKFESTDASSGITSGFWRWNTNAGTTDPGDTYGGGPSNVTDAGTNGIRYLTLTGNGWRKAQYKMQDAAGNSTTVTVVIKVDTTKPTIATATPSTTSDIASYVDFNATDAHSQIKYYNISTSNTAPTTWIPVVSDVEAATETKYENNAAWARVFHHNNHWGNVMYSNTNSWAEAKSSSTVDKYSVLGNLANYKDSSKWEFLLQYPDYSSTQYNRWTQTVNPATTTVANGTGSETAGGYTAVHADWTTSYWGGLTLSTDGNTFINGSVGHGNWYYAIGARAGWKGGIPGPDTSNPISTVNLWSRIDNLTTTTSANLTRRLGDLKTNATYYVWVKDAAGNTASKAVTVSNVDTTAPTATITSTNNVAASQTATLTLEDNVGVDKYYWGTSNPTSTNVTYTAVSNSPTSTNVTKTVNAAGTYYLAVLDKAGNRTITSKVFYKTTLTPNRGTVSPASVITMSGNSFTLPTPGAVTGYTWGGWYKESGLTTSAGTSYKPTGNTTLYGKWTAKTYTITYDYNHLDGDIYESYPYTTRNFNNSTAVGTTSKVNNTSAKYGTEMRWTCTTAGAGGAHMTPGKLTVGSTYTWSVYLKASKNITLNLGQEQGGRKQVNVTTSWQRFTYTFTATEYKYNSFTFYAASGTPWAVGDVMYMHSLELKETPSLNITTQTKTYGNTLGTLPTATRTGYKFDGWYTAPVGGTKISSTTTVPAANTTYYAQWTVNTYTIKFNANGGSGTMSNLSMTYGTAKNLTANTFTRSGYVLKEWNTKADGSGTSYTDKQLVNNLTSTNGAAFNLYAIWKSAPGWINMTVGETGAKNILSESFSGEMPKKIYINGDEQSTIAKSYYITAGSLVQLYYDSDTITNMEAMFMGCRSLTSLDVGYFDTSQVVSAESMFRNCSNLTSLDLSLFYLGTNNVENMSAMFSGCSSLTSLDLSSFDTNNVRSMSFMFNGCSSLTSLDLSLFATNNVRSMDRMFSGCSSLKSLDVSSFDTRQVVSMYGMFNGCSKLITIYASNNFDTSQVTSSEAMFENCSYIRGGAGTTYNSSYIDKTRAHIDGGTSNPGYFTAKSSKSSTASAGTSTKALLSSKALLSINSKFNIGDGSESGISGENNVEESDIMEEEQSETDETQGEDEELIEEIYVNIEENQNTEDENEEAQIEEQEQTEEETGIEEQTGTQDVTEETSEETKEESINEDSQTDLESTTAQIAQIGETTYETLESAIQAVQNGEEIKLLEDIQLEEEMKIDTGQNVILNLNGKTISSTSLNTIVNNGILTITGTGIIRNEIENGTVIYNTVTLNLENGVITTNKNGGKAVQNVTENTSNSESNASANSNNGKTSGVFNMKAGKIVTEGIGAVGIYNGDGSKVTIEDGIIEVTGNGSKAIYNNADLEITGGKIIVSGEDAMGIYNGKTSKTCEIKLAKATEADKAPEIIVEAEEIEHYDEIKNTDQFKEQLAQMKPSYGIYNDAETEIVIEAVTIQVERLKGVGIRNNTSGTITLGIEDEAITTATPTINAVADNTTALQNSEKGQINFYDGNFVTLTSVKENIDKIPKMSEIQETINKTIMKTILITTGDASQL